MKRVASGESRMTGRWGQSTSGWLVSFVSPLTLALSPGGRGDGWVDELGCVAR